MTTAGQDEVALRTSCNGAERFRHDPIRIVMAVNNPGSNDYRVVKSAEIAVEAGYECHVVGLLRGGLPARETINGVHYHRIPLRAGVRGLLYGLAPQLASYFHTPPQSMGPVQGRLKYGVAGCARAKTVFKECVGHMRNSFHRRWGPLFSRRQPPAVIGNVAQSTIDDAPLPVPSILSQLARSLRRTLTMSARFGARAMRAVLRRLRTQTIGRLRRFKRTIAKRLHTRLTSRMNPTYYPVGVNYLFGRYLEALLPTLVALEGDIYHAHELWALESCALAARLRSATLLYDSHELELHRNIAWAPAANRRRVAYERRYLSQAHAIFTVSEGLAKVIGTEYARSDIQLLRNTPRRSTLASAPLGLRATLGLAPSIPLLVYTGSLTINRGLELVVEALVHLTDFHFATVGPWAAHTKDSVDQLARDKGVAARVHLHPAVPPQVLIDFISSADVAVIPIQDACLSYHYCMPNKLFEAAFAALPIVASDLPDVAKFIHDNAIGEVFDSTDIDALIAAIRTVYFARDTYYRDRKLNHIRDIYAFEHEAQGLLATYRKLAAAAASNSSIAAVRA